MIDTHAHLTDVVYDECRNTLISSFVSDGLEKVFTVGYDLDSSKKCVELATKYDNIYAIIGVHPENAKDYSPECEQQLTKLCQNEKVIAIGEIGLDYHYEGYDKECQKRVLLAQMQLAHKLQLPIVIHLRDAVGDFIPLIKEHQDLLEYGMLLHCYSESIESYEIFSKMGIYVAFGGVITFKNATRLQEVVKYVPLDRIVLETDCPYLAPVPYRGTVNEPKNVLLVAEKIAELKNIPLREVLDTTTNNALKFFSKVK